MGFEEDIVVADTNNHRVQVFDKSGEFKYQFGIPGKLLFTNGHHFNVTVNVNISRPVWYILDGQ